MLEFRYRGLSWNLRFGVDALDALPAELEALALDQALVLTTPTKCELGSAVAERLGASCAGLFAGAQAHVPAEMVRAAEAFARSVNAQCTVSIGGGSTVGLGKALASTLGLANVAVPTTYAGSEMTDIFGITEAGQKVTTRSATVLPDLTIYDPKLTLSLPASVSAASGMNAMAQAVANVATATPNPLVASWGLEAVRSLSQSLPRVVREPENLEARATALYGACLAGAALGAGSTGLHHRLCHVLGGAFGAPHAETHAVLLPHTVAVQTAYAARGTEQVAVALGANDAALGLQQLASDIGAPTALEQIGLVANDLTQAAKMVAQEDWPFAESRSGSVEQELQELLERAFLGAEPRAPGC